MSHRHDDADPVEHDPTGMRALLGSLPGPGPMPEHLVARITAALEEESRGVAHGTGASSDVPSPGWAPPPAPEGLAEAGLAGPEGDGGATVVPLRRRRTWLLGAAAAAVVVIGLGGVVADRLSEGGLVASLGISQGADDAGSAESAADAAAPESAVVAGDAALGVVVVSTGTDYTAATLGALAAALPTEPGADRGPGLRADGDEPLAGPAGPGPVPRGSAWGRRRPSPWTWRPSPVGTPPSSSPPPPTATPGHGRWIGAARPRPRECSTAPCPWAEPTD